MKKKRLNVSSNQKKVLISLSVVLAFVILFNFNGSLTGRSISVTDTHDVESTGDTIFRIKDDDINRDSGCWGSVLDPGSNDIETVPKDIECFERFKILRTVRLHVISGSQGCGHSCIEDWKQYCIQEAERLAKEYCKGTLETQSICDELNKDTEATAQGQSCPIPDPDDAPDKDVIACYNHYPGSILDSIFGNPKGADITCTGTIYCTCLGDPTGTTGGETGGDSGGESGSTGTEDSRSSGIQQYNPEGTLSDGGLF